KGGNTPFSHTIPPMTACKYGNNQNAGFGGDGGRGGDGGQNAPIPGIDPSPCNGAVGQDGLQGGSAAVIDFDLPLASMLFAGQQLPKFHVIGSPNGRVLLAMQGDNNLCLYASG